MPFLPARPSAEHLRKQAKRLAATRGVRLAVAQRLLSNDYGFRSWSDLLRQVASVSGTSADGGRDPALVRAVRDGDVEAVRRLLDEGANPRLTDRRGETPLHLAARLGPLPVVEALIAGGAFEWQADRAGRTPLEAARRGRGRDRAAIVALLDHTIADPSFQAAVAAIHAGDAARLAQLLDAEPRLLRDRIRGAEAYRNARRPGYFTDPKLFWFIANNPMLVETMPATIVDVARVMIERGVAAADLDYALELTMTSRAAREQGHQGPLMRLLLGAGAVATRESIVAAAGYRERDALRVLLGAGVPLSAPIAAALGDAGSLATLLAVANPEDVQTAFGLAVINGELDAARLALDAGADANAYSPVHTHMTALHQAAGDDNVPMIGLLLARGARRDVRDTLWDATPLDWATYLKKPAAAAAFESFDDQRP